MRSLYTLYEAVKKGYESQDRICFHGKCACIIPFKFAIMVNCDYVTMTYFHDVNFTFNISTLMDPTVI